VPVPRRKADLSNDQIMYSTFFGDDDDPQSPKPRPHSMGVFKQKPTGVSDPVLVPQQDQP